ncbi:MAG: head-tail adaptor protein [Proteobacteria bacterium]|nr:head-tail adaptor protein [Pseudomonadota bacterium]
MSASFDIGALDRRLILLAPVETPDGASGVTRSYDAVATVWGSVTPLAARADVAADSRGASLRVRIVIRFRDGVTTRHRIADGTHSYAIVAVREITGRRFLEIDADERQD